MQRKILPVFFALMSLSCAPIGSHQTTISNSRIEVFPSPYASDSDFLNLVSDDRAIREQAHRNIIMYYNCLLKANPDNNKRQDPMVLSGSRLVAFSEIPEKIYETRQERLAQLITEHNKAVMQSTVEKEMGDLKRMKWDEIKKEVNSIATGGRKAEMERYGCPISEAELRRQQRWFFEQPSFVPPLM